MAKQTFTSGQVLTAQQMNDLQTNDFNMTVSTQTANYTLAAADKGTREVMNMSTAGTVTVPNSTFDAGDAVWLHSIGSGTITLAAGTGLTLNSSAGTAPTLAQWEGGVVYFTSASAAIFFRGATASNVRLVEYVIIAGGGSGGAGTGNGGVGGGGAGGYRSSVIGENSGGGLSAESRLAFIPGNSITVTVGAGGTAASGANGNRGSSSSFGGVTSTGGGGGQKTSSATGEGGSGGGGSETISGGAAGTTGQGFAGGNAAFGGGGGGGAGAVGVNGSGNNGGAGGAGVSSSITNVATSRAGGGGGSAQAGVGTLGGSGGTGGGGAGAGGGDTQANGTAGTANTGGGGGGTRGSSSGAGGSGIVIIRYEGTATLTSIGAGLTSTTGTYTSGGKTYRFYSFTAGTDTVTF